MPVVEDIVKIRQSLVQARACNFCRPFPNLLSGDSKTSPTEALTGEVLLSVRSHTVILITPGRRKFL